MSTTQWWYDEPVKDAELRRRLRNLGRLIDVTGALAEKIDPDQVLSTITHEACQALGCDRASLYQFDIQRQELYTRIVTELEINEIRHGLDVGITGYVARSLSVANVPDPAADERWYGKVDRSTGYHTRNILAAPLVAPHDGRLLGVLQLLNKHEGAFDDFDEHLLVAYCQHAAIALDRAGLVDELRRREQMETSLNVARDIQRGFMPRQLPEIPGYEVASWWFPNEAVGGDYCDVLPLRDGRIGLVIADVSGHGLGPALIMASVRAGLRALVLEHTAAELLLGLLGRALSADLQDGRFITMVMAGLDPVSHGIEYANAGHAPALHYSAAERSFHTLESTGMPLGVLDRPEYPQGPPLRMQPGDLLVLCTDGIVEAVNHADEQFGLNRLQEIIAECATGSVENLTQRIAAEVENHYVGSSPADDLTVLALRRQN